jgi:hypothetical protein
LSLRSASGIITPQQVEVGGERLEVGVRKGEGEGYWRVFFGQLLRQIALRNNGILRKLRKLQPYNVDMVDSLW